MSVREYAELLTDQITDLEQEQTVSLGKTPLWTCIVAGVRGGYAVRIVWDGSVVVDVTDSWLARAHHRSYVQFVGWREAREAATLEKQLVGSLIGAKYAEPDNDVTHNGGAT